MLIISLCLAAYALEYAMHGVYSDTITAMATH
jgi:hypothetical protein